MTDFEHLTITIREVCWKLTADNFTFTPYTDYRFITF